MITTGFNGNEGVIDVRDVIERFESINDDEENTDPDDLNERDDLAELLADLRGNGGDEQWQGDWYPITLVRDSYFTDYAQRFAEDIGAVKNDAAWPHSCIDWERAANEFQQDYTSVEFAGTTYWYR